MFYNASPQMITSTTRNLIGDFEVECNNSLQHVEKLPKSLTGAKKALHFSSS